MEISFFKITCLGAIKQQYMLIGIVYTPFALVVSLCVSISISSFLLLCYSQTGCQTLLWLSPVAATNVRHSAALLRMVISFFFFFIGEFFLFSISAVLFQQSNTSARFRFFKHILLQVSTKDNKQPFTE